jgi:hypothetical protein
MDDLIFEMTFSTHAIRVRRSGSSYHCWKYTDTRFDYEYFDSEEAAMDYITTAPPSIGWHVTVKEVDK